MFYCDKCAEETGWGIGFIKSFGICEVCGKSAKCSDVPSKFLPIPNNISPEDKEERLAIKTRLDKKSKSKLSKRKRIDPNSSIIEISDIIVEYTKHLSTYEIELVVNILTYIVHYKINYDTRDIALIEDALDLSHTFSPINTNTFVGINMMCIKHLNMNVQNLFTIIKRQLNRVFFTPVNCNNCIWLESSARGCCKFGMGNEENIRFFKCRRFKSSHIKKIKN